MRITLRTSAGTEVEIALQSKSGLAHIHRNGVALGPGFWDKDVDYTIDLPPGILIEFVGTVFDLAPKGEYVDQPLPKRMQVPPLPVGGAEVVTTKRRPTKKKAAKK